MQTIDVDKIIQKDVLEPKKVEIFFSPLRGGGFSVDVWPKFKKAIAELLNITEAELSQKIKYSCRYGQSIFICEYVSTDIGEEKINSANTILSLYGSDIPAEFRSGP